MVLLGQNRQSSIRIDIYYIHRHLHTRTRIYKCCTNCFDIFLMTLSVVVEMFSQCMTNDTLFTSSYPHKASFVKQPDIYCPCNVKRNPLL